MSVRDDDSELLVPPHLVRLVPELGQVAGCLTCPICYEAASLPAITPCHHLFCSLCIRKFLQYKQVCPSCHTELHESSLRQDKTAERILALIRPLVASVDKMQGRVVNETPAKISKEGKENVEPLGSASSTKVSSSIAAKMDKEPLTSSFPSFNEQRTPCNVCSVPIPEKNLKIHQETCGVVTKSRKEPSILRRPKALPKLVYALLKDTELRKKCKEFGLTSKGEKSLLTKRLQKYTLLYNTEILLENPRSPLQIAMQVLT